MKRILALLLVAAAGSSFASNGLLLTATGAHSSLMGGADTAHTEDATTVNANPAGMRTLGQQSTSVYSTAFYTENRHGDQINDERLSSKRTGLLFGAAGTKRFHNEKLTAGLGLFVQGGFGYEYNDLRLDDGTRDDASVLFTAIKLTPAIAFDLTPNLRAGATLGINYTAIEADFLPNTSLLNSGGQPFFGMKFEDFDAISTNLTLGLQWQPNEKQVASLVYSSPTDMSVENGSLSVNMQAAGLGTIVYRDAKIKDMGVPQKIELGYSHQFERLRVALELSWLEWSDSMSNTDVIARKASNGSAPIRITFPLDFHDQWVMSIGLDYRLNERTRLLSGVNLAQNPVPTRNLNPFNAVIFEEHLSLGFAYRLSPKAELVAGVEYQPPIKEEYNNAAIPVGRFASESNEGVLLHTEINWRW